jgi:hypothetical protein
MTDTQTAQRRLLEALAEQAKTPGGLPGMRLGFPEAIAMAQALDQPAMANVWRRLDELMAAVDNDLSGAQHG